MAISQERQVRCQVKIRKPSQSSTLAINKSQKSEIRHHKSTQNSNFQMWLRSTSKQDEICNKIQLNRQVLGAIRQIIMLLLLLMPAQRKQSKCVCAQTNSQRLNGCWLATYFNRFTPLQSQSGPTTRTEKKETKRKNETEISARTH